MTFYYYKGNWVEGKIFITEIWADSLTIADEKFEQKFGINPKKDNKITVSLKLLK